MSVIYSDPVHSGLILPDLNRPRLKTALVGYHLNEYHPLLTGEDILGLKPEKRTPTYLSRIITARTGHLHAHAQLREQGDVEVFGEHLAEQEQYGLMLRDNRLLKTRWKPSLILVGGDPLNPAHIRPRLRLDSLLHQKEKYTVVKSATEPVSEERAFEMVGGMTDLRCFLDGRDYSLLLYTTPEANSQYIAQLGRELKSKRFGFEQHTLPFTTEEVNAAGARAYDTFMSGKISIELKDLTRLRLVS